ncbi:MAG: phosphonate ABC transporter substrate-binding protein, partial [Marinobacter sp. 34-60-7]
MRLPHKRFSGFAPSLALAASALVFGVSAPVAAECQRGALDVKYCDENGDMVADLPANESEWVNPDTLIF